MGGNLTTIGPPELEDACKVLFGSNITVSRHFLENSLQVTGVKKAYRRMALVTHPDSASGPIDGITFHDVREAYERLLSFLDREIRRVEKTIRRPTQRSGKPGSRSPYRTIPKRSLRLGEFLYFSGVIPLRALINSVTWQQNTRPKFGEIAMESSFLDRDQLRHIIMQRDYPEKVGDAAARLGILTPEQVEAVLRLQRRRQSKIGSYYLDHELIDAYHLFYYLSCLKKHNTAFD